MEILSLALTSFRMSEERFTYKQSNQAARIKKIISRFEANDQALRAWSKLKDQGGQIQELYMFKVKFISCWKEIEDQQKKPLQRLIDLIASWSGRNNQTIEGKLSALEQAAETRLMELQIHREALLRKWLRKALRRSVGKKATLSNPLHSNPNTNRLPIFIEAFDRIRVIDHLLQWEPEVTESMCRIAATEMLHIQADWLVEWMPNGAQIRSSARPEEFVTQLKQDLKEYALTVKEGCQKEKNLLTAFRAAYLLLWKLSNDAQSSGRDMVDELTLQLQEIVRERKGVVLKSVNSTSPQSRE